LRSSLIADPAISSVCEANAGGDSLASMATGALVQMD
jgi:hypothetical protein